MYVILLVSVIAAATVIERAYMVLFRYNLNGAAFMAQVQKLIMANNIDRAIKLCNAESNAALTRVLKAGLTRANRSAMEIQNAVDEATLEIIPQMQKRTAYLSMWANVATLTGLLGTISGLVQAFKAVGAAAAADKQEMLAKGISVAMYTTAYGLVVAIPVMICHSFISNRTVGLVDDIDQYSVKLINLLSARQRGALKDDGGEG
ncbi:MAG TPA: MotA/TolQ/ExbB proton channel family protein [Deltaproteobacteria bacterium]|nr:transporter [Deltaproteobacteria bacterium]HCP47122.1 MotA/TolQ/ExbB proton channel family protein [Deltaproteobacteria bacterium]|tara:strand:+ start:670 stop:1284 length:615 start_codon:yes stop_codon:yes gene_type:complete